MIDLLRDRIEAHLAEHRRCLVALSGADGASAFLAPYRARGLEIECLLPVWSDAAYYVEHDPRVMLVVAPEPGDGECWLQVRGTAEAVRQPEWGALLPQRTTTVAPDALYRVICVRPARCDLYDDARGWGARETLDV
jgi:hypothetical protein